MRNFMKLVFVPIRMLRGNDNCGRDIVATKYCHDSLLMLYSSCEKLLKLSNHHCIS